jgi:hypothetical protein
MQNKLSFQERIQQQKLLTFEDIVPKWAKKLNQQKGQLPSMLSLIGLRWYFELLSNSKCIVGEAYGFSPSYVYNCKKCYNFGWEFMDSYTAHSRLRFERNKELFVKHWNEQHMPTDEKDKLITADNR